MGAQHNSRPDDSPWRNFVRSALAPAVAIIVCIVGGLVGAWGLPRLVILVAPHSPAFIVYGSAVVGIFAGIAAGIGLAQLVSRSLEARA